MTTYGQAKTNETSKVHYITYGEDGHKYSVCSYNIATTRTRYGKRIELTETTEEVTCASCQKWMSRNG